MKLWLVSSIQLCYNTIKLLVETACFSIMSPLTKSKIKRVLFQQKVQECKGITRQNLKLSWKGCWAQCRRYLHGIRNFPVSVL